MEGGDNATLLVGAIAHARYVDFVDLGRHDPDAAAEALRSVGDSLATAALMHKALLLVLSCAVELARAGAPDAERAVSASALALVRDEASARAGASSGELALTNDTAYLTTLRRLGPEMVELVAGWATGEGAAPWGGTSGH